MTKALALAILLLPAGLAAAQDDVMYVDETPGIVQTTFINTPYFFAALVAGIILALAFQLILTNLSLAAGLNILGPVVKKAATEAYDGQRGKTTAIAATMDKISTGLGLWAMVTTAIALFFACWLAVELALTGSVAVGAIMGMVIWGLFYITMMLVESAAVSSLIGSIMSAARSGLRSMYSGAASVLGKSSEEKMADAAKEIASSVRDELFGGMDIEDKLDEYVRKLRPRKLDARTIRKELAELLSDVELRAVIDRGEPFADVDTMVATLRAESGMSEERARDIAAKVSEAVSQIREEAASEKDPVSKVADSVMRIAGVSPEKAAAVRSKLEEYLRSTGKQELQPETIKHDLEMLVHDPKQGVQSLKSHMRAVDKDSVATVIAQTTDMSTEDAKQVVNRVAKYFDTVTGTATSIEKGVTDKLRSYLSGLNRPELDYAGVSRDVRRLFSEPGVAAESLMNRLKSLDRETLKRIVASRRDVSEEDAEQLISRIEATRDEVVDKARRMRDQVEERLERIRDEAVHQADEARKSAAYAAWWGFAAALVSGAAATLGGIVAVVTD